MEIEFVNHASILVETGGVRLLCDPWIEGRVFEEGWDLLAPSVFTFDDFARVTHIWFSHEHPDHFFPSNLKEISEEDRKRIHVLFQHTEDKKVVGYCKGLGFGQVSELPPGKWVPLARDVQVLNRPLGTQWDADSWLCVKSPGGVLLNINDCGVDSEEAAEIRRDVGKIDLLATQFSYAEWHGNEEDVEGRRVEASGLLERVKRQIQVLEPEAVLPFASFSWFCAEENFYLNAEMNRVTDVAAAIVEAGATPIVLYPGDHWTLGAAHDAGQAIARYEAAVDSLADRSARPLTPRTTVSLDELMAGGQDYRSKLRNSASPSWLSSFLVKSYVAYLEFETRRSEGEPLLRNALKLLVRKTKTLQIFLSDHERALAFDLEHGLRFSECPRAACDVSLTSGSLLSCFRLPWGAETLMINGRFQVGTEPGTHWQHMQNYFKPVRRLDLGRPLDPLSFLRSAWTAVLGGS